MTAILGIDAAWTATEPSGVALIRRCSDGGPWVCVAVAPSYESFITDGNASQWQHPPTAGCPEPGQLLEASELLLAGERVSVVAIDIPLSNAPIIGRRCCDREISRNFGAQGCSTHSPNAKRPGPISTKLLNGFCDHGYDLAVDYGADLNKAVIEVYPHPALLSLLNRDYRVPYKVSRSSRYWPETAIQQRVDLLMEEFGNIYNGLAEIIQGIPNFLPAPPHVGRTLTSLKRYEDALDALVCAWVGACYIEGNATAYGDNGAAIWIPTQKTPTKPAAQSAD